MAYGSVLTDVVQSSTAATAPTFKDGNGTQIGTLCRAWVNFNGTGTVAIRASFNVSSITDNGTGDYTVNFTTAMPDANYSTSFSAGTISGSTGGFFSQVSAGSSGSTYSTTSVKVDVRNTAGSYQDADLCCVSVFR